MPRSRNEDEYQAMVDAVKAVARRQMMAEGTASLSLRAIARELDVTAPALYRYFPSRDDLITALVVDGFLGIAIAMEEADQQVDCSDYRGRMIAIFRAYRAWAQAHPIDFQLIYGNPIPGYEAPSDVTVPAVLRGFRRIGAVLAEAYNAGKLIPRDPASIPATVYGSLAVIVRDQEMPAPPEVLYALFAGWTKIHGLVMLELLGHLDNSVGDIPAFFESELAHLIDDLGFT